MHTIQDFGVSLILFLQNLGPWLALPMKFFTFLGNEEFYLLVAPFIYWSLDAGLGLRVGLMLMTSDSFNSAFKLVLHSPRPFWTDLRVHPLVTETSFGVPSGHAQNAVVVWGWLAHGLQRHSAWLVAGLGMFLIGLSRIVLGVHFLGDVLLGWLIGLLILLISLNLEAPVVAWLKRSRSGPIILLSLAASLLLILIVVAARLSLGAWTVPGDWIATAAVTLPGTPFDPLALAGVFSSAGAMFGLAAGAALYRGYNAGGMWWKRIARFILGLVGVLLIWRGLALALPGGENLAGYFFRYLRYALTGFWISAGGPWTFMKLNLTATPSKATPIIGAAQAGN